MDEPQIRGHVLEHVMRFYRDSFDHSTAARIEGELSIDVKAALDSLSPAGWYPRSHLVEVLKAFAAVRGSGDSTYGDFVRCGIGLAEAKNDFTRLLMQVMTPDLFLKKLPRFWARDHKSSGAFDVQPFEAAEHGARVTLRGVRHYDHAAVFWLGFIQGVLIQLGAPGLVVRQVGWSWSSPGPQDVAYEVRWS
jgi:hypothetical protein